jgi:hypothetical protein
VPHATIWLPCCVGDWYCAATERGRCNTAGLGAVLGLFGSNRANTALTRQRSVARFWKVAPYQLNVFALTWTELNRTGLTRNTFDSR